MSCWLLLETLAAQELEVCGKSKIPRRRIEVELWCQAVPARVLQRRLAVVARQEDWLVPCKMRLQRGNRKSAVAVCFSLILTPTRKDG